MKIILIIFVLIISFGFIKVSSNLPRFIKNNSKLKVFFTEKPFNLTFETDRYILYINDNAINNIKENIFETYTNIKNSISIGGENTSKSIQKTFGDTFDRLKKLYKHIGEGDNR